MEFRPAEPDKVTRWTTAAFGLAVIGLAVAAVLCWQYGQMEPFYGLLPVTTILALVLLIVRLFRPVSYVVMPDGLTVRRVGARVVFIPWAMVESVRVLADITPWNSGKTAGSSGLFGHFGGFRLKGVGAAWLSATNLGKLVLLQGDKNWVISPEEPDAFVGYAEPYIAQASGLREQLKANFAKAR